MAIMEITVNPIGTKTPSISKYVASSEKVLAKGRAKRVFTTITIDDRIDKIPTIEGEIASLKKRLMKFPAK